MNMFKPEELLDLWSCSECKKKVKGYKKINISKYPNILIIELCYNSLYEKQFKYHTIERLDGHDYILYGILARSGTDLSFGHYYSIVLYNSEWYKVSDNNVSILNHEIIKTDNAILLLYCSKEFSKSTDDIERLELQTDFANIVSPLNQRSTKELPSPIKDLPN